LEFKKVSFPEPGWYSRGLRNTMFKWNGESWTGETKMTLNADANEHAAEVSMISSELKKSKKSRALDFVNKILPLFVATSGIAAAIWYSASRKSK
jgi:hypothetical protein